MRLAERLYFILLAFIAGEFVRIFWLWLRSRRARRHLRERDAEEPGARAA